MSSYTTFMDRDFSRGFLPPEDPLLRLSDAFDVWEETAQDLSKLALSQHIRPTVEALPPFPSDSLVTESSWERAMTMLSFMANLYVFAPDHITATRLPRNLAVAWHTVATHLHRPPMLAYAGQVLYNWRRLDPDGPVAVGNLAMIQNFLGGMDEEWFVTLHVNIEAEAGRGLKVLPWAQQAVTDENTGKLSHYLAEIAASLVAAKTVLLRMPERCDPNTYYHRVRPYMFGWKDNPDLPGGMVYEGVNAYHEQPREFRGETGAQSSVIYAFDAILGIAHEHDAMRAYLNEMRDYMPMADRAFIEAIETGPSVRNFILQSGNHDLQDVYNECVKTLYEFRKLHIEYAALYIIKPADGSRKSAVGTGGTPFTVYLKKHIDETLRHLIS
jgi:indoleamine 2,3-dioxygenase